MNPTMTPLIPTLVFLPGIGADHRMYKFQTEAFPNSYAVDWIDPLLSHLEKLENVNLERVADKLERFSKTLEIEFVNDDYWD